MPQLDKVTFFSQFFWLSVFFIIFYIAQCKLFLPRISRILKLRIKKMSLSNDLVGQSEKAGQGDTVLSKGISLSRSTLNQNFQNTQAWVQQVAQKQQDYQKIAQSYIQSIGEISLSQNLAIHQPKTQVAEKLFALLLFNSLKKIKV